MYTNFWKFYSWIYAAILFPTGLIEIANIYRWRFVDYLFVPSIILGFLVLYSYAYKVKIFSQKIWKVLWWYSIAWLVISMLSSSPPFDRYYPSFLKSYYEFEPKPVIDQFYFLIVGLICVLTMLPLYYANYVLAFDKKYLNSKKVN